MVVIAALSITEASPAKRFSGLGIAGIGSIGGIGGAAGCVVTGNKLFANGIFLRDLTSAEQQEMVQYEKDVKKYKEEVKKIMEDKREEFHSARKLKSNKVSEVAKSLKGQFPKAPEKPSFCSDIDTTQYYFDGCMVQGGQLLSELQYVIDRSSAREHSLLHVC
ncbi:unnamed protein product [Anisakis simplex]|uniref:Pepsin inhibitor-3-like repeated domain-containing protein n=1 Tax=Anisakis simplex TaxID=6269 RepID=A0A3P6N545_ANISI|nr:unnamed protein product [Anisakis simplex]